MQIQVPTLLILVYVAVQLEAIKEIITNVFPSPMSSARIPDKK